MFRVFATRALAVFAMLAVALTGCSRSAQAQQRDSGATPGPDAGPAQAVTDDPARVLARGRGVTVTAGDVVAEINSRPPALRAGYAEGQRIDQVAREILRRRLLAIEARRRGLADDPVIAQRIEAMLSEELLRRELAAIDAQRITPREIEDYYQAHLAAFTKPERVRASVIVVRDQALGRRVVTWATNTSERRFLLLVRRNSLERSRWAPGSDVGWILRTGGRVDPAIVTAAFALQTPGQVGPEPIQAADGRWYVLRFEERLPVETTPLADVRSAIETRIRAERRAAAADAVVQRVGRELGVRVTPANRAVRVINVPPPDSTPTPPAAPGEGESPSSPH